MSVVQRDNKGRFMKGCVSIHGFKKGFTPWNKGIHTEIIPPNKGTGLSKEDAKKVKKIYDKEYRKNNHKQSRENNKRWHKKYPNAKHEEYLRNTSEYKLRYKKYRLENKEKIKIKQKEYQQKNPEKIHFYNMKRLKKYGFPLKLDILEYRFALRSWSATIKKLGNGTCQVCNSNAEISHHLIYKKTEPKLSLNLNNGIALCKNCHYEVHGWNFKKPKN